AKIIKLKKKANPVIKHFKAYQKRISKEQRQQRKSSSKKKRVQKESVSKQGRKNAKGDGKAKENAQSKGRTKEMMDEDKETDEVGLSTAKEGVSTDFEKVSTDRPKLSTDDLKVSTDEQMESNDDQVDASEEIFEGTEDQREGTEEKVESTAEQKESTEEQTKEEIATQASQTSTQTPSSMIFGDDETIATLLINMSKAKTASKEKLLSSFIGCKDPFSLRNHSNQQNPQNNQRQNQGNPKGSNQASTNTQGGRRAPGRVYSVSTEVAVKDNNVVNGTFLINNVYALVLFDTGADRSFVSYTFSKYIDIPPTALDTNYSVELADGKSLTTSTILRGCTLNLQNHLFKIDLLPIELGSFDVIVGMDWMAEHRAEVVCYAKYIHVPYRNDMLIIQGERSEIKK
ncbi:putative reverse transcriptase domain-containing protein, partial [Tanacetum coccineum]